LINKVSAKIVALQFLPADPLLLHGI